MPQTLYVGFFVAGGKLRECCVYPDKQCATDTMLDHLRGFKGADPVTDYGTIKVDTDGSWTVLEGQTVRTDDII